MPDMERITISLIPRASAALAATTARDGLSKTDVVNRAITLYDFITSQTAADAQVLIEHPDGTRKVVEFL